jgi:hypothetical protein
MADRGDGTVFGATEYGTDASPWPPRSPVMDTQLASVVIDHVQSRAVVIASEPGPPAAENADGTLLTATWHLSAVGALTDVWVELQPDARQASATTDVATSARNRQWMRSISGIPIASASPDQSRRR